jgi:hypothetical protein
MATKHTPGPWSADKWAPGWTVSAPEQHYSVCHLEDCNNADGNAPLIAASPRLLTACELARTTLTLLCGGMSQEELGEKYQAVRFCYESLNSAIRQAKEDS